MSTRQDSSITRRALLGRVVAATIAASVMPAALRPARAFGGAGRIVVNVALQGGPDLRHLLPPAFDATPTSYGYRFWQAKASAHALADNTSAWEQRFANDYFATSAGLGSPGTGGFGAVGASGVNFGILKSAGWLKRQWDAGHVALVNNVVGATTRDHAHCTLVLEQGNRGSGPLDGERSGWGGRLAQAAGANLVSVTRAPSGFCYGPEGTNANVRSTRRLVDAHDTRAIGLFRPAAGTSPVDPGAALARSLGAYYRAKRVEMPADALHRRPVDIEQSLRQFAEPIEARLANLAIPAPIAALYTGALSDAYVGQQFRDLYDCLACEDILGMHVASMEYGGWDSHRQQVTLIERKLADLFGDGRAFDALYQALPAETRARVVFVINGEFGRQLRANGDAGTDHGSGNTMLVIGDSVRGGTYGEMFPAVEIARLGDASPEIEGRTEIDRLFGALCDWVQPGSGDLVFPQRTSSKLESGLNLTTLVS